MDKRSITPGGLQPLLSSCLVAVVSLNPSQPQFDVYNSEYPSIKDNSLCSRCSHFFALGFIPSLCCSWPLYNWQLLCAHLVLWPHYYSKYFHFIKMYHQLVNFLHLKKECDYQKLLVFLLQGVVRRYKALRKKHTHETPSRCSLWFIWTQERTTNLSNQNQLCNSKDDKVRDWTQGKKQSQIYCLQDFPKPQWDNHYKWPTNLPVGYWP